MLSNIDMPSRQDYLKRVVALRASVLHSITFLIVGVVLASCGDEPTVTLHPADELVPTYDSIETPIVVEKGEVQGDHSLSAYIAETQDTSRSVSGTGIYVENPNNVEASRLDDDRFLVLDERNFELLLFSEASAHIDTVATNGDNPGNVAHASGLDVLDDVAYVSTRDRRIETYDCEDECTYLDTRSLQFMPYDVAVFGERVLASAFTYSQDRDNPGFLDNNVLVLRGEKVTNRFMKPYASSAPIVAHKLNRGQVVALDGFDVFTFEHLPYVYVFQDGDIHQIYEIGAFHVPEREGRTDLGPGVSISVPMSRVYSMIERVQRTDDAEVVVTVETTERDRRLVRGQEPPSNEEVQADYYAIDLKDEAARYLGTLSTGADPSPRLIPTTGAPVIVRDGEIFYF